MLRNYGYALLVLVVALCFTDISCATTSLKLLGQWAPSDPSGAEQVAFDDVEKVAYLVGGSKVYVIDLSPSTLLEDGYAASTPRDLPLLSTLNLPTTLNDVAFCGKYLAVSANGASKVQPGSVTIFSRYRRAAGASDSLEQLAKFTVGAVPDQIAWSVDCKTLLVSNEGEPLTYTPASLANDPEGSVSIINLRFCADDHRHRKDYGSPDGYAMDNGDKATGVSEKDAASPKTTAQEAKDTSSPKSETQATKEAQYGKKSHERYQSPRDEGYRRHGPPHGYKKHRRDRYEDDSEEVPVPECDGEPITGIVRTARFNEWNDKRASLIAQGVKLTGINATVAQDLEPECTSFSHSERLAFVSLQENNAVAVLDVRRAVIRSIHALGFKDHSKDGNALDASDRDGPSGGKAAILKEWPLFGMYMPDEVKAYSVKGEDYFVAANEGDARGDWPGLTEETRLGANAFNGKLDPITFPDPGFLRNNANLGRLQVLTINGAPYPPFSDPSNTGNFSRLLSFGARSFSIWKVKSGPYDQASEDAIELVFDSGSQLEQISKDRILDLFNMDEGDPTKWDERSDNKGPEPEGLVIGPCAGGEYIARPYYSDYHPPQHRREYESEPGDNYDKEEPRICLYLGTERTGVVFVYDITNPYKPEFQSFARPPTVGTGVAKVNLVGPEGLAYTKYNVGDRSLGMVLVAYEADAAEKPLLRSGLGVYAVTDLA